MCTFFPRREGELYQNSEQYIPKLHKKKIQNKKDNILSKFFHHLLHVPLLDAEHSPVGH